MNAAGGLCRVTWGVRSPGGSLPVARFLCCDEQQQATAHACCLASFRLRRQLYIRRERSLHTSAASSGDEKNLPARSPQAERARSGSAGVAWPADIQERARQLVSQSGEPCCEALAKEASGSGSDFVHRDAVDRQLQVAEAGPFWQQLKRTVARSFSGEAAAADASFGGLEGPLKGTASAPIVYKRFVDGMTAAHHYPSRLLPAGEAAKIPPHFRVTPFDLEDASLLSQALGFRGTELFKAPSGMQPATALVERLYGRVSLLFLFDIGGQHSQLPEVAAWLRLLEQHDSFVKSVYGPLFTSSVSTRQRQLLQQQQQQWALSNAGANSSGELASISYLCVDHAPLWLRPFALRSMRRLSSSIKPLSPFHNFPQHLPLSRSSSNSSSALEPQQAAALYLRLVALIGSQATKDSLVGSLLGYTGSWGALEIEAFKRKRRDPFVTLLLVDRDARVRWHARGLPTEEAVLLLLSSSSSSGGSSGSCSNSDSSSLSSGWCFRSCSCGC
ncbi:hypothetical protein Efla_005611 [Eimeria flavescens]